MDARVNEATPSDVFDTIKFDNASDDTVICRESKNDPLKNSRYMCFALAASQTTFAFATTKRRVRREHRNEKECDVFSMVYTAGSAATIAVT